MTAQIAVLLFSGVAYLIMNGLLIFGMSGMRRGLRLFRHLDTLQALDASDAPLPETEVFKTVARQLEQSKFSHIGNFRVVSGEDDKGHIEYVYTAPNQTAYASIATLGDFISVGIFTLFSDQACVETHMAQGADAQATQITKPDYILQTFDQETSMRDLYKRHKQNVREIKDLDAQPTSVKTMHDLLKIEAIYIDKFTRRRLRLTFRPGPVPVSVIAVFYIPLSSLFIQGLATELAVSALFTVLLPLSITLAAAALGLVGMFMVVARG